MLLTVTSFLKKKTGRRRQTWRRPWWLPRKEELKQAADIVSGKPFLLRTKFGDPKYAPLDRLWSSADAYMDLAASAADAAEYFKDQKGPEVEKLFWSQFHAPVHPLLLNERLTGWAKLHRLSGLAMRSVVDHLWPGGGQGRIATLA